MIHTKYIKSHINNQESIKILMSGKAKNFLVILEINNLLFHLNNPRFKKFDSHVNRIPINYQDKYNNIDISYRKGKN